MYNFLSLVLITHIVLFSGQTLKLFVNGGLVGQSALKKNTNTDGKLFTSLVFGAIDALFPLNGDYYNIQIDDFAIWSKDLSEVQISYIMKQSRPSEHFHVYFFTRGAH